MPPRRPKRFGNIPGIPVGTMWSERKDIIADGVHAGNEKGISGTGEDGAWSIIINGGYEDDIDEGDTIYYSGAGGRGEKTPDGKSIRGEGPQTSDQSFDHVHNRPLKTSSITLEPVRVIRGSGLISEFAPLHGFRYDGLYEVTDATMIKGKSGFKVCLFTLKRLPHQPPLPRPGERRLRAQSNAEPL